MRFNFFFRRQYQRRNIFPHNIKNTGGQGMVLKFPFYIGRQKLRSQLQLVFVIFLCSPNIHVLHEILFIRSRKFQTIDIDFSNHLFYGTTCEVGL